MNILNFTIQGQPQGKQRARKREHGNWYNPQSQPMQIIGRDIENKLPDEFNIIPKNCPVIVNCLFFFEPAKSQKTKKFLDLIANDDYPYCKKSDLDNCMKFCWDILSGIIFHDDNQIYSSKSEKYYSLHPRTEIEVIYE